MALQIYVTEVSNWQAVTQNLGVGLLSDIFRFSDFLWKLGGGIIIEHGTILGSLRLLGTLICMKLLMNEIINAITLYLPAKFYHLVDVQGSSVFLREIYCHSDSNHMLKQVNPHKIDNKWKMIRMNFNLSKIIKHMSTLNMDGGVKFQKSRIHFYKHHKLGCHQRRVPEVDQVGGGSSHIDMVYVYVPAFWGAISRNLV